MNRMKNMNKLGTEGTYLNTEKTIYNKPKSKYHFELGKD